MQINQKEGPPLYIWKYVVPSQSIQAKHPKMVGWQRSEKLGTVGNPFKTPDSKILAQNLE